LQPANEEAGNVLRKITEGSFWSGKREREEEKSSKKTSDKFSESQKVYYFCTPASEGDERREKVFKTRKSSLENKRKKGFVKAEKVSTFADPNGRVLEKGKEVKQAKAILA
jgi:hypothetical protein